MDRSKIQSVLSDEELFNICDIYNPRVSGAVESSSRVHFKKHFEKVAGEEILIPVLGMQGVGKSTFINALVMKDAVSPVDALETTCIPIEVRYTEKQMQILIYFSNGEIIEIDKGKLIEYAVEENNPSNEKGVDRAVILINNPLLSDGVVLVDLPGVGSTTEANVEVTYNYLGKLVAAIYLLKVYQPISRTEAAFIKNSVNDLGVFWFVQNRWKDDRDTQVKEAEEHNRRILKEKIDNPDYIPQIFTIKVKQAFDARMKKNDPASSFLLEDSNIGAFISTLQEFKKTRHESMFFAAVGNLNNYLENTARRIETFIKDASDSYENIEKDVNKKLAQFRDIQSQNDELYSKIKNTISEFENDTVPKVINGEVRSFSNILRDRMHQKINAGIVDGDDLNRAFSQTAQDLIDDASLNIVSHLEDFSAVIRDMADNFKFVGTDSKSITAREFRKEQEFKYEKSFPALGGVGGGIIMALILAGPETAGFSWLVAGAVAVASVVGGFIGNFFKKMSLDSRKAHAKSDLENIISDSGRDLKNGLKKMTNDYVGELNKKMNEFIDANRAETKNRMQQESDRLNQDLNAGAERVEMLKNHLNILKVAVERLK